jgi:hypothetical protein
MAGHFFLVSLLLQNFCVEHNGEYAGKMTEWRLFILLADCVHCRHLNLDR